MSNFWGAVHFQKPFFIDKMNRQDIILLRRRDYE